MKTLGNLIIPIEDLMRYAEEQAPSLKKMVDSIISDNIDDKENIESMLDLLVKYAQLGYCIEDFKKLNTYYSNIDRKNAKKYDKYYKEMFRN